MLFNKKIDFELTDMHTHLLYNTDDGPKELKTSVAMMDIAYQEGIRRIVLTPHYHPVKCMIPQKEIEKGIDELREIAAQIYPDLKLYQGREVYYTNGIEEEIIKKGLTINNTRYVLVEFDFNERRQNIRTYVGNLLNQGLIPIIAHIERYYDCIRDEEFAYDLKDMGALIQINSSAVLKGEGQEAMRYTRNLLKEEVIDIIATDAHSDKNRAPRLREAVSWIANKCGVDYARKTASDNIEKILNDMYLD